MDDLMQWLGAQLDEDERVAKAANAGPWSVNDETYAETIYAADGTDVVAGGRWGGEASVFNDTEDALHIVRHDPARVLREVEAKRRILAEVVPEMNRMDDQLETEFGTPSNPEPYESGKLLRLLALPYADRPGYRDEWRP